MKYLRDISNDFENSKCLIKKLKADRDLFHDDLFIATVAARRTYCLETTKEPEQEARFLFGGSAEWKFCYENVYPYQHPDHYQRDGWARRALHLDSHYQRCTKEVTVENYFTNPADMASFEKAATLEDTAITAQLHLILSHRGQ